MSTKFSRTLFVTRQGEALQFFIRPCAEKIKLRPLIEERGGLIANRPDKVVYRLVLPGDKLLEGSSNSLKVQFIYDCIASNQLLPLDQYRVHRKSDAEIEDELDIDNLEDDDSAFCINTVMRNTRSRKEYCNEDDMNIISFILKNHSYAEVKGRAMWIKMEERFGNRTWQSLKERYLKRIIPNLSGFRLPDKEYALLKKGAGAWTRQDRARVEQHKARRRIVVADDSDSDATVKFNQEVEKVMEQDSTPGKENVGQRSPNRSMEKLHSGPRNTRASKVVDNGTNISELSSSDKDDNISRSGPTEKSGSPLQASSSVVPKDNTAVKSVVSSPSQSKNSSVQPRDVSVTTRSMPDSKKAPEEQANDQVVQRKTSQKTKYPVLLVKKVAIESDRLQNLPSTPTSRNLKKPVASVSPINETRVANREVTNITFSNVNSLISQFASKPTRLVRATPQGIRQDGSELQSSSTSNQSSELETETNNVSPCSKPEACSSPVLCRSRTEKLQLHKLRKTLSDKLCVSVSNFENEEKLRLSSTTDSSQFSSQETNPQSQLEYLDCTEEFRLSVLDCLEKWRISLGDKLHTNESAGKSQTTPISSQELEGCQNMDCSVSLLDDNGAGLHLEHLRKTLEEKMKIQSSTGHSSYQTCCSNNTVSDADSYDSVDELILAQAASPDQAVMLEKLQAKMKKKIMQGNSQVKSSKRQSSEETLVDSQEIPTALPLLDSLPFCSDEVTFVTSSPSRKKLTPLKTHQSGRPLQTTPQSHKRQLTRDATSNTPPNKVIRQGSSLDVSDRENGPVSGSRTPPLASNTSINHSLESISSRMTRLINETKQRMQTVNNCVQSWQAKSRKGHGLVAMNDGDLLITKSELETFLAAKKAVNASLDAVLAEDRAIHIVKKLPSAVTENDTLELENYLSNFQK